MKKLAGSREDGEVKRAESVLYYIEKDLRQSAQQQALEAAQVVGPDRLLDGRPEVVQPALAEAGIGDAMFETLHLEGSSPRAAERWTPTGAAARRRPRECWPALDQAAERSDEDAVPWIGADGRVSGILRFRFSLRLRPRPLIRDYFEKDFRNPEQALVVRVTRAGRQHPLRDRAHHQPALRGQPGDGRARPSAASSSPCATATPPSSRT